MQTNWGGVQRFSVVAALVVGYVLSGRFGLSLASIHPSASAVWPPTGIALAAVLLVGYRVWPAIFLSAFVVNITTNGSFLPSLGIAAGNTLEGMVGGYLVNTFARGRHFGDRLQDIIRFTALASIASTTVSATVGVTSLALGGLATWDAYGPIWFTWWLGDAVGALLVTPPLVLWDSKSHVPWNYRKIIELSLLLLALYLVGQIALGWALPAEFKNYPLALMYIPFLAWAAFRFGQREAVLVMLLLSGIVLWQTLGGHGPFARGPTNRSLLVLQCFMGIMAVTTLVFAAFASERKRAEHATAQLAALVGSSDDAIIGKSLEGTIFSWNAGAERLFGYSEDEAVGAPISLLIPPDRLEEERLIIKRISCGERVDSYETVRRSKNGTFLDVSLTVSPIKEHGVKIIGASTIARDITARKRMEAERERLLTREHTAREAAETASRLKDEFLATVSHELRTPLNAIFGWAQLLLTTEMDDTRKARALQAIERNAAIQVQLTNDLLDVSSIIAGKYRLDVRAASLIAIAEAAIETVRPAAKAKNIALHTLFDPAADLIRCDSARIQQVVWNLLSNAIKFTPACGEVYIGLTRMGAQVQIRVRDTGEGIAGNFLPHVFERFRQADASITRKHMGLGLGLSIVRHVVEMHGGTVGADSAGPGQGATFTVNLPIGPAPDPTSHLQQADLLSAPRPAPPIPYTLDGIRVLIVDDEENTCEIISSLLTNNGANVRAVTSAAEAHLVLEAWRPDVILSDLAMPGEDGLTFLRKFRARTAESGALIPAVAITAYAGAEDRLRAIRAGYQSHLSKPLDAVELLTIVASLAGRLEES